jgi:hypothetical protein
MDHDMSPSLLDALGWNACCPAHKGTQQKGQSKPPPIMLNQNPAVIKIKKFVHGYPLLF